MLWVAGPVVEVVGLMVVVAGTPWPVAWNRGAFVVTADGQISVVVLASLPTEVPSVMEPPSAAATGRLPRTSEPAAPAAAAPASFRTSRRLCGALFWPFPFSLCR